MIGRTSLLSRDMRETLSKLSEADWGLTKILRTSRTSWVGRAYMMKLFRHFWEQITTRDAGNVRYKFQTFLKFPPNKKRLLRTIDDASEPPRMFGELLEPKIRMLDFAIFSTFASFANRSRVQWNPNFSGKITAYHTHTNMRWEWSVSQSWSCINVCYVHCQDIYRKICLPTLSFGRCSKSHCVYWWRASELSVETWTNSKWLPSPVKPWLARLVHEMGAKITATQPPNQLHKVGGDIKK